MKIGARAMVAIVAIAGFFPRSAIAAAPATASESDIPTVAAQFFRAGRAAYDRHEYRAAALAFLEAYRRVPRSAAIYDAARAWEAAGENELAADAFARALPGTDLSAEDVAYAHAHLDALSAPLALVHVTAPAAATVWVENQERGTIPIGIHLAPGSHEIHVHRKDGSDVSRTVVLTHAGETIDVAFEDVPVVRAPPPTIIVRSQPESHGPSVFAWITVGVAAAAAVGGVVTYDRFTSSRSTFEASGEHDSSAHDDASRWRTTTYILWGGAVAIGALGGVLLATTSSHRDSATQPPPTTATLRATATGITFTVLGY